MSNRKMWFGNLRHAQWVPVPSTGARRTKEFAQEELQFLNGGLWIDRSSAGHLSYTFSFPVGDMSEYEGIEAYQRFAAGDYGSDFVRFVDPMYQDRNLFSESWATPGLFFQGAKRIYVSNPTVSDFAVDTVNPVTGTRPTSTATYDITTEANAVPIGQNCVFTLLIPPGYTLHLGAVGSITGTAAIAARRYLRSNGSTSDTFFSPDNSYDVDLTVSGDTYYAVDIYLVRTTDTASTITLESLIAQILPNGDTPNMTQHIPGYGHSGLRFRGDAQVQNYIMQDRHLVGAAFDFAEVQPWQ